MANESFIWGANGSKLTPEQIAIAQQLLARKKMQGADTSPVQHWSQGAARVADALGDVLQEKRLGSLEKESSTYNNGLLSSLLGSSGAAATPGATGSAMPTVDASGNVAVPSTGKEWETIAPRLVSDLSKDFQLSPEQAAGVVGQLGHESAGFGKLQEVNPLVPGSRGGYGYAQWTGPRRKEFEAWTGANGLDPNSYEANYGFLKNELANSPEGAVIGDLRGAPDALTAGRVFTDKFLRPGIPNYDSRNAWTQKALAFANAPAVSAPGEVASLDPSIGIPMPGAEGQMRATAPAQPMPPQAGPQAALPVLPASTVGPAPAVASVPPVGVPASDIPPEFQNSPQLMNADPKQGILAALLSGSPASPQQVAQAQTLGSQPQVAPSAAPQGMGNEAIIRAITDPRASEGTRRIAGILLQQQQARQQAILQQQLQQNDPKYRQDLEKGNLELQNLRNPKLSPADEANIGLNRDKFRFEQESSQLTPDIKEYKFAKDNGYTGSFAQYQTDMKKSAANNTTINTGEGNKFYNTLDENNAKIFSGLSDAGIQGRSKLGQIDQLDGLLQSTGSGWATALKAKAGDYGINTEKLDDIQAASALISKLIPAQREPGSGPVSDADLEGFRNSLPRLINQPGGNATIINTMRGLTQYQIDMGTIADRVANREITPAEGRAQIANLPNPLSNFKPPPAGKEDEGWQELSPGVRVRKVK